MKLLKLTLLLVAMALPCLAADGPQAFGALKFGMNNEEMEKVLEKVAEDWARRKAGGDTGSTVRRHFVINGTKYPSKLSTARDKMPFSVSSRNNLETKTLGVVLVHHDVPDAAKYDEVKEAWEVLRDIAQSKFGPAKKDGGAGVFPALETLQQSETIVPAKAPQPRSVAEMYEGSTGEKKSIVTDVWETREGVRVELSVEMRMTDSLVRAVLKASK